MSLNQPSDPSKSHDQPQREARHEPVRDQLDPAPVMDRRSGLSRAEFLSEIDGETGLERRRGPGRRRTDFAKSAEEGEMTPEQFVFIRAIDAFKVANNKMYPTWTDVLEVVRLLGYRKTQTAQLKLRGVEDWTEAADARSGVRSKPGHAEPNAPAETTEDHDSPMHTSPNPATPDHASPIHASPIHASPIHASTNHASTNQSKPRKRDAA